MQQILVNLIALAAAVFVARLVYRGFAASRKNRQTPCNGCGTCEAAREESPAKIEP